MNRILFKLGMIVTMDSARRIVLDGGIVVAGNRIERVLSREALSALKQFDGEVVDAGRLVAIPGFVQTHLHLCQTLFRGLADDLPLLDWLQLKIFPFEAAHNAQSMYASAMAGIAELLRSGTTTILDMGSVHHEEEIVRAIEETGLRAFVGKAMMDVNDIYPKLKEPTAQSLATTRRQAEQWHKSSEGRIQYAVAPRFVLSCSDQLLREAYEMTKASPGMLFHTHAAENRNEMDAVRKRCKMDNIEFFESIGILHSNTCLAHCIWLNEREIGLLRDQRAKVVHCPSSNLKLGSGVARVPELLSNGVSVSLGADGAPCNNTLNMFEEMRLAALIQKPLHGPRAMNAQTVFEMATSNGAAALGLESDIGSIEPGKKGDLVLLDINQPWNPYEITDVYSSIVYSGSAENVHSVLVDGKWVYKNKQYTTLDGARVMSNANNELRLLLQRVH
jgi:5-methylthioadenosine/S-adenosylhomocysteine deaminase